MSDASSAETHEGEKGGHGSLALVIAKYASSNVYRQILGVVTAFLRPKLLTPEQFGLWTLLNVIPSYAVNAHLGSQPAMRYRVPFYRAKNDPATIAAIQNSVFTGALVLNLVVAAALILMSLAGRQNAELWVGLVAMAAVVMLQWYYDFYISVLKAHEEFPLITASNYIYTTVSFVLTVVLLFCLRLYGLYAALILTHALVILYLRARYRLNVTFGFQYSVFKDLVIQGFPIMISAFAVTLISTSDRFVISYFLGQRELGYYGIAITVFGFLTQLPGTAREVMEPRLMRVVETSPVAAVVDEYLLKPLFNTAYLMPLLIGPVFFLLPVAIPLILPRYVQGIAATQILSMGLFFLAMSYVPRMIIVGNNWQLKATLLLPFVLAANVGLDVLMVKLGYGLGGVAVGSSLSYLVLFLTFFIFTATMLKLRAIPWGRHLFQMLLPFAVMGGLIGLLQWSLPGCVGNRYVEAVLAVALYSVAILALHGWAAGRIPLLTPIGLLQKSRS